MWVYFLKTKDQVLDYFKLFHAMVERDTGKKLKCLRTDNGGEYTSREFDVYCGSHGIRHERTVPRTPQHNGVAERMNRTIMEKVRSMIIMAKLPKPFWGEAVRAACYLINRSPSVSLNFEIPKKVWSGKKPSYSHLRVFGCLAFVHVSKELRQKLDARTTPCIFLGYGDEEFGYRLWDPKQKQVIRSRDVVFLEDQTIEDIEKPKVSSSSANKNPDSAPAQPATDRVPEQIPEAESEEAEEIHEQGESLPAPATGSSTAPDDDRPPETSGSQTRRSARARIPSTRYSESEYILLTDEGEPEDFQEAISHIDKENWLHPIHDEMKSLQKN